MSETLPMVYVARHGETAWSLSGQYTGRTDLPLTERGERTAARLGERLKELTFAAVFTSPLQCASRTCALRWLRRYRHDRSRSGRVELRPIRRPSHCRNCRRTGGLAVVP